MHRYRYEMDLDDDSRRLHNYEQLRALVGKAQELLLKQDEEFASMPPSRERQSKSRLAAYGLVGEWLEPRRSGTAVKRFYHSCLGGESNKRRAKKPQAVVQNSGLSFPETETGPTFDEFIQPQTHGEFIMRTFMELKSGGIGAVFKFDAHEDAIDYRTRVCQTLIHHGYKGKYITRTRDKDLHVWRK